MPKIFDIAYDPAQDPWASTVDDISAYYHVVSVSKGGTFLDKIAPSAANYPNALAGTPSRYFQDLPMRIDRSDLSGSRPIVVKDETTATTLTRVTGSPSANEYRIPPEASIRRNMIELHSGQAGNTLSYDYYGEASMFTAKEWNSKRWVNYYSVTDNYTILDNDWYDEIHVAHSSSTKLVTVTLPTVADNSGRIIRIENTGAGLTIIDGEGAETISLFGNSLATLKLLMEDDYIEVKSNGTEWKVKHYYLSMITNFINRSDWTNVHIGSAFTYDNKSAAVDLTGQHFQVADGGSLQKAIILYDSGGVGLTGTMYVYNITDSTTSLGVWTNNQTCTVGSGGYTFDVNEGTGSSKNIDYNIYHGVGIKTIYFNPIIYVSSDGTDNNTIKFSMGAYDSRDYSLYQIDTNYFKLQSGLNGIQILDDAGTTQVIDTENYYCSIIWNLSF